MKEDNRKVLKSMMMVTQLGIVMMVPIFLCGALGVWLNRITGIDILFPLLVLLGIGSGFRSVYMVTKSFYASDMKKEREKQQYIEDLKNYKKTHPDEDFSDVMDEKRLDNSVIAQALRSADALLQVIYSGKFVSYTKIIEDAENI